MNLLRRRFLHLITGAAALPVTRRTASAETYPSRPVAMINPFPAGGPLDALARLLADRMSSALGQSVIVENVTGAAGSIGTAHVARSAPDGYTLGLGYWGTHVANEIIYSLPYDVLNDFQPIAELASGPLLLIARPDIPVSNSKDLIDWLKTRPGNANFATAGVGTAVHVVGILFEKAIGVRFQFIPYRGVAPAIQDLLAGHVDMMFTDTAVSLPYVRAGTVKTFMVTANSRSPAAPEIPTVLELGFPGLWFSQWYGLWAPKGTPADMISKVNAAVVYGLAGATVRQQLIEQGLDAPPVEQQTPQALGALQKAEIAKWWPILKAEKVRVE